MRTIEKLLQEYKIRFRDTEKIKEEGYPWGTLAINTNGDGVIPLISGNNIWTKNGKVWGRGIWATADLKEVPDKWVVEKDESHPAWEKFKGVNKFDIPEALEFKFIAYHAENMRCYGRNNILDFKGHQFLTLDQWAEFFLPKYKVGDKVIVKDYVKKYNNKVLTITKMVAGTIPNNEFFCYFKEAEEGDEDFNFITSKIVRHATQEEIEESQKPKVDFSILNDTDVFYLKSQINDYLFTGGNPITKKVKGCVVENRYRFTDRICDKDNVMELREANDIEKEYYYTLYPELGPIKAGDWVAVWDDKDIESLFICKYKNVKNDPDWDNIVKVDITDNVDKQIDEFLKQQTK